MVERSVRAELADASKSLEAAGRATPRVDAELLLSHVLGIPRTGLVRAETMSSTDATSFEELVRRRADGAPLQHLTGSAPFRHIDLREIHGLPNFCQVHFRYSSFYAFIRAGDSRWRHLCFQFPEIF